MYLGMLGTQVPRVALQFSMAKASQLPQLAARFGAVEAETPAERLDRKSTIAGTQFITPSADGSNNETSLVGITRQLADAGYQLVQVMKQTRPHGSRTGVMYSMIRYVFYRNELAKPAVGLPPRRDAILAELEEFLELALWRVRGYLNPYHLYNEGAQEGQGAIQLCMEARNPLFMENDRAKPICRWVKDAEGNHLGDAPIPMSPTSTLEVVDGGISLFAQGTKVSITPPVVVEKRVDNLFAGSQMALALECARLSGLS